MGEEGPGILALLRHKQETPFDRLFVASQSSAGVCSLLVPHADDRFGTSDKGGFGTDFVKIFSADSCFPKSFGISVEGKTVASATEARELNGEYKEMTVKFHADRTELGPVQ
ncbi:hypothetical protein M9Y10_034470 [Tritrichomonas musculus]|uniref:Uncharacterized protein n=1 Tax=Tritrichomonas musculus TaxID=1915356 RepID=A0ABR2KF35_9EUKA